WQFWGSPFLRGVGSRKRQSVLFVKQPDGDRQNIERLRDQFRRCRAQSGRIEYISHGLRPARPYFPETTLRPFKMAADNAMDPLADSIREQQHGEQCKGHEHNQCLELERVRFTGSHYHLSKNTYDEKVRSSQ